MNRIFTYICLVLLGFGALQANGQAKAGKKPVKKGVLFPDVFFAGSTVANGPVKVKDLETMLRSKLQAHDSSGTSYKVLGFDFTYAERGLFEDSAANLSFSFDYLTQYCPGDSLSDDIIKNIFDRLKAGDTVYVDHVRLTGMDNGPKASELDSIVFFGKSLKLAIVH